MLMKNAQVQVLSGSNTNIWTDRYTSQDTYVPLVSFIAWEIWKSRCRVVFNLVGCYCCHGF
ncbi:unnamed protein product [Prunus brigantina]